MDGFGLSLMGSGSQDDDNRLSLHNAGAVGYSDVYSLGIVYILLELLFGCKFINQEMWLYVIQDEILPHAGP